VSRHTHLTTELTVTIAVEFIHAKGEPVSFHSPGEPGHNEILTLYVDGKELRGALGPKLEALIDEAMADCAREET
jgi:hypothetical protein